MVYEDVNPELPEVWTHDTKGDFIEGVYLKKKENIGKNKANMYFLDVQGTTRSVWGTTVIDNKMEVVSTGNKIKITFLGVNEDKGYKDYQVQEDKMEQETQKENEQEEAEQETSSEQD